MRRPGAILLAAALALAVHADALARTAPSDSCGTKRSSADLLCRSYGSVTQTAPSDVGVAPVAVARGPIAVASRSTVRVGTRSLATMAFGQQAQCAFGVLGRATEIVTRWGGDDAAAPSLFWQRLGNARCRFTGRPRPQTFFCELSVRCPVVVTTRGPAQVASRFGATAQISRAVARAADLTTVTPVILDFCASSFQIDVSDEFGGDSVGGGGFVEVNGVREPSHERVVIKKLDTFTQTDTTTVETHEISIESRGNAGHGDCPAQVLDQRRRRRVQGG
ncbi:MAG TPA: hypothetical protein VGO48_17295 [Conexibacter sp.]|jgi:hypothetical protein|nr:hypothetical protein [Conexibacter sp.]